MSFNLLFSVETFGKSKSFYYLLRMLLCFESVAAEASPVVGIFNKLVSLIFIIYWKILFFKIIKNK
jgi:hypothetical protein